MTPSVVTDPRTQPLRGALSADAKPALLACLHCGQASAGSSESFCCVGCRVVYYALRDSGLTHYYDLRGKQGEPVGELQLERRDRGWLDARVAELAESKGASHTISLQLQGVRCAACVWLIERLFARFPGQLRILVNPAFGRLDLMLTPDFDLRGFVAELERFGYLAGPVDAAAADDSSVSDGLLLRLGICGALAMNAMMFAAAIYLGLREQPLYGLLQRLGFGAASLSVVIGGPVFVSSALQAIKRRVLHLDVPIALGIVLSYAAAVIAFVGGHAGAAYFDSLSVFIALMLLGRYLQERALARNRRELLADDGADSLRSRRIDAGHVRNVPFRELRAGDELVLAPGDLVPADSELCDELASCSLDWINGEAQPRDFGRGDTLPAGAFNIGMRAVRVRLKHDFAQSRLIELLRAPAQQSYADQRFNRFAAAYVAAVLLLAGGGFAYWALIAHDFLKAIEVATAVCVITCPCAIGIAIPLSYELVHASLRRRGLFVRSASFLDRARAIRKIVFDKTGTLTTGQLRICEPDALVALPAAERRALYDMVSRSLHPKSIAIKRVLDALEPGYRADVEVLELPGQGLEARIDGHVHRLGRPTWAAAANAPAGDVVYAVDGRGLLGLHTAEELRPGAAAELDALAGLGCELFILSGDAPERVRGIARALGLPEDHAMGGHSPEAKAAWVAAHDRHDLLMIGDGINDSLAVQQAYCSGTPAIDRALLPGRTDFYFTTAGLAPLRMAITAARSLSRTVRGNFAFAVLYNAAAVSLALSGLMRPWLAAILMPLSSLFVLARSSATLSYRSRAWKF
jgi:Cu2+-exporting ATPase